MESFSELARHLVVCTYIAYIHSSPPPDDSVPPTLLICQFYFSVGNTCMGKISLKMGRF